MYARRLSVSKRRTASQRLRQPHLPAAGKRVRGKSSAFSSAPQSTFGGPRRFPRRGNLLPPALCEIQIREKHIIYADGKARSGLIRKSDFHLRAGRQNGFRSEPRVLPLADPRLFSHLQPDIQKSRRQLVSRLPTRSVFLRLCRKSRHRRPHFSPAGSVGAFDRLRRSKVATGDLTSRLPARSVFLTAFGGQRSPPATSHPRRRGSEASAAGEEPRAYRR